MDMSRRDFVRRASQVVLAASSVVPLRSTGKESPAPIAIIDTHQHLWDMDKLATKPNIICKISGIVDNVPGYPLTAGDLVPMINHCLDAFGPERVVFGSDWPVCLLGTTLRTWVELLQEVTAGRPENDRRKLFHDNAIKFYDLAP